MTYIEIAVSDGPGTLLYHTVMNAASYSAFDGIFYGLTKAAKGFICQTLTEPEYQDFIAMHGGTVAT
jgi:hypothetical protein